MTEDEWLTASDPKPMLDFLKDGVSDRKLRLWTVMCCRKLWPLFRTPQPRSAVGVAERYADGEASDAELAAAHLACDDGRPSGDMVYFFVNLAASQVTLRRTAEGIAASHPLLAAASFADTADSVVEYGDLLRDIFGNPFRPVFVDPSWLSSTVVALAEGIYAERAFDRMPILADALQDAGCEDEAVLCHSRQPGEHVRGCWLVDLLTGRK